MAPSVSDRGATPRVSVLVPTYGRERLLVESLEGLLRQDVAAADTELLVYDQTPAHEPGTESFLRQAANRVRIERGEPRGVVAAYRACVELSRGAICVFVDDDVLISSPDFVARHLAHYEAAEVGAVVGQVLHEGQTQPGRVHPGMRGRHGWRHVRFDLADPVPDMPSVAAGNMSFRRTAYERVGGFDPCYAGNGFRFETDFSFALRRAGYRIPFEPRASLVHRYGSLGGAENRHLGSLAADSHAWYEQFFANSCHFLRKWYAWPEALWLLAALWREHAFNRAALRAGPGFLRARQRAFLRGARRGWNLSRVGETPCRGTSRS